VWRTPILLLGFLAASACRGDVGPQTSRTPTISPSTFTRVLSDLVAARVEVLPDTVEYRNRREAILRDAGVTAGEVRSFLEAHGQDADLMARIYHRAAVRLDTLAARHLEPAPPPAASTLSPRDSTP
jgi:hypothetical protein